MRIGEISKVTNVSEYTLRYEGDITMPERLQMLEKHRQYVLAQQKKWEEYLENLDSKIIFYKDSIEKSGRERNI